VLVAILSVMSVFFTQAVPRSYDAARIASLPPAVLLLAMIIDSARLARTAPVPFPLTAWQSWPTYGALIAITGFAAPWALGEQLASEAGVVRCADESMVPALQPGDVVIIARNWEQHLPKRGDVVALAPAAGQPEILRRIVGLPGEEISVKRGIVHVSAQPWFADKPRGSMRQGADRSETMLTAGQVLVLPDAGDAEGGSTPLADLTGRARWILFPGDFDLLRVGADVQ